MRKSIILGFFIFSLSFVLPSCDGGGTGGDIILEGVVLNFSQFGEITVTVLQGNTRLGRTTTSPEGNFGIRFNSSTGVITLRFESSSFNAERPNIRVVNQSVTNLDITLQQNPTLITINRWQVFQDPLSLSGDREIEFNESLVEFNLDANGGNCIFASGNSLITYRVKSISITNCREGVRAQTSASIILEADESIQISSNRDAILTLDDAFVEVGKTSNPVNNTIIIQSANQFGRPLSYIFLFFWPECYFRQMKFYL